MPIITREDVLETIDRSISQIDARVAVLTSRTDENDYGSTAFDLSAYATARREIVAARETVSREVDDTEAHAALERGHSALVLEDMPSEDVDPEIQSMLQTMLEDEHRRLDERLNSNREIMINFVIRILSIAQNQDASTEELFSYRRQASNTSAPQAKPNYSFLMSLFSAPLSKIGAIVLCMSSLVLFGLVMSAVLPTTLGLTLAGISLVSGLGLFANNKTATEHVKNGPTMTHEASTTPSCEIKEPALKLCV